MKNNGTHNGILLGNKIKSSNFSATWMDLDGMRLSEVSSQREKV